ncbi:hypothetical protein QBC34DRAFT_374792 [Podospora aff. communis PSN243]|uniref:Uncharacterized protein n=1 Tax=Podospora aff. communis PSN243 TaxID=3040156 RepID=A0AAV9H541_9PEZI|nr:hypothetical protein QBC34DRAFT_374792 [Podospora aff. communis PSN243]
MANRRGNLRDVQQFLTQYGDSYDADSWSPYNTATPRNVDDEAQSVGSESTPTWEEESNYTCTSRSSRTRTARSASIFSRHSAATQQSEAPPPQWDGYDVAGGEQFVLWCEFHQLIGCDAVFRGDDEARWIQHHIRHLKDQLPATLVCWFCDDQPAFVARQSADRGANFVERMQHIRQHINSEWATSDGMRPDFFMVEHMYGIRAIDKNTYRRAMAYSEIPRRWQPAADDEPPITSRSGAVVVNNGGRERRHRRHERN